MVNITSTAGAACVRDVKPPMDKQGFIDCSNTLIKLTAEAATLQEQIRLEGLMIRDLLDGGRGTR